MLTNNLFLCILAIYCLIIKIFEKQIIKRNREKEKKHVREDETDHCGAVKRTGV